MNTFDKARIASAAFAVVAAAAPALAADLGGYGSTKDGYVPLPQVVRDAAGPCYFRADVGYSWSRSPDAKWPVNNITQYWSDDPSGYGETNHHGANYGGSMTGQSYTYVGDEVANASLENTWLGEIGAGCGTGSRGFRAEVMLGFRGDRKFDGEPREFTITNIYPNDPSYDEPVTDDPMHTSLKTYTLMLNIYKDLGNWGGFVPYVGAGVGAAYHQLDNIYFTQNPFLTNQIHGNNDLAFAWSLMAGVGYQISDRAILDVGYRYIDMGSIASQRSDTGFNVNPAVRFDDLTAHEIKVGLRYHLGGGGTTVVEQLK
ncbi:MAG: porin family protein [Hyphomicrobiaceae bacterium]|nr:porin family protein [Hyphomicrobiaceae bacterium]